MADGFDFDVSTGYQNTDTYRFASPERRRQFNRYKKDCNISDEHMFLILFEMDMQMVPEDQRKKGDTATTAMLVTGFLLLWTSLQSSMNNPGGANVPLIFLSVGSFVLVAIVYFMGLLNPYKRTQRRLNRELKKMPEVQDFYEWERLHPSKEERKQRKASGRNKGRK